MVFLLEHCFVFFLKSTGFSLIVPRTEPNLVVTLLTCKALLYDNVFMQGLTVRPYINPAFTRIFPVNSMNTLHNVSFDVLQEMLNHISEVVS